MHPLRIAVLRGGPSKEYEVSLRSGANVLKNFNPEKYKVEDIFISKDGTWHKNGVAVTPDQAVRGVDMIFNALHGDYGEDGRVQRVLEHMKVPYSGSGSLGASMSLNKDLAKKAYKKSYLKTPEHIVLKADEGEDLHKIALSIFREFPQPSVIKPVSGGSSHDIHYCSSYEDVYSAIDDLSKKGEPFMIEEYIFGKEASTSIVENFRGEDLYSFSPVEIQKKKPVFSYNEKYGHEERNIYSPGRFSSVERDMLKELAKEAHDSLGLRHYSQSDFIISPRGIFILETNALPGLTEHSLIPESLFAAGLSLSDFLDHLVNISLKR